MCTSAEAEEERVCILAAAEEERVWTSAEAEGVCSHLKASNQTSVGATFDRSDNSREQISVSFVRIQEQFLADLQRFYQRLLSKEFNYI